MVKSHTYSVAIAWTGNLGEGTANYRAYSRNHEIQSQDKPIIYCSSDPSFRGDPTRYNPEELLVGSISACHMLWYLHLCASAKIVVTDYVDNPVGVMEETSDGSGRFTEVTLKPRVAIANSADIERATRLHEEAHKMCFIANSVNFPIRHSAETVAVAN
ncbi:OsmC family peroxiredoxin [Scytonema sp. UIC 10036]|uniref:OsmC family protein n=1 Tax=Scytonema sp. UIC 10036 TaxID=2304196 RepID=UPI0012DA5C6C|nr:OsmC family protein [Scytonema sp. UIC 10036]MUG95992.1 OsmC family peroxiredoxin [Scytonema sp. UIC 10036]